MIYTYEPENEIVIDVVNRICYQKTKEYLLKLSNVTIKKKKRNEDMFGWTSICSFTG
jgi:hypothetical protein